MLLGEDIPLEQGHQRGVHPLRNRYFTTIGSSSVRTVAAYQALLTPFPVVPTSMTLNDLET